jgi:hypothetical protein
MSTNKFLTVLSGVKTLVTGISESTGVANANTLVSTGSDGKIGNSILPAGVGAATETLVASEALAGGDFVNIWDDAGTRKARKADASNGRRAMGFVSASVTLNANATVVLQGVNGQLTSLTVGAVYFLSAATAGGVTTTAPTAAGNIIQELGVAISTTGINFEYNPPISIQ